MKKIALIFAILFGLLSFESKATHLAGGEITWECLPNGNYIFTLILYRDCGTGTAGLPTGAQTLQNSGGGNISCSFISLTDVSPTCYNGGVGVGCGAVTSGNGAIEQAIYKSGQVTLTGTPPAAGWTFTWSSCCRPVSITNVNNPSSQSYFLRAIMFPYNNGLGIVNANPCYDNSPKFLEAPKVVTCSGYKFSFNNFGFDEELDSLHYSWADPLTSSLTAAVPWATGYNTTNPLPGVAQGNATNPFLDGETGQVQMNVISPASGSFATCMKIAAYKCGQKIAEVYRDIPFVLKSCSTTDFLGNTHLPPQTAYVFDPTYPPLVPIVVASDTIGYSVEVCAGQSVQFDVNASDFNVNQTGTATFAFQTIEFFGAGGNLGTPYTSTTNCLFQPPCATVTPLGGQVGYENQLNNDVQFNWNTTCDHLDYQANACGQGRNVFNYYLQMKDNSCPAPYTSISNVQITVNPPFVPAPIMDSSCVSYDENTGQVDFSWTRPGTTPPCESIDSGYVIYYSANLNGPYTAIDSIADTLVTNYSYVNPVPGNAYYFVRSKGECGFYSEPSDTLSVVILTLTATPPPPNSSQAQLDWNVGKVSDTTTYYQIWREVPTGSGNWSMIDSTQQTTYTDVVNICGANMSYQIRVGGSCFSTTVGGYFSDQTNADTIAVDSITVQNSQSILSWQPSTLGDVIGYVILQYQPGAGGWVAIDTVPLGTIMPYTIPGSTPNVASELYKVVSIDSCDNQSSDLVASRHNTIFMRANVSACDNRVRIGWNTYQDFPVATYEVVKEETNTSGVLTTSVIYTGGPTDSAYTDQNLVNGFEYCYYIKMTDTSGTITATSNIECFDAIVTRKSDYLYAASSNVTVDGSIELVTHIDAMADVISFEVQRGESAAGPFRTLGVVQKPVGSNTFRYLDFTANTSEKPYYYRVTSTDSCGNADTVSNFASSLHLRATPRGDLINELRWNSYREYGGDLAYYEIWRAVNNSANFQLVTSSVSATDSVYYDNIKGVDSEGKFTYYIRAVEANNPWGFVDETGMPYASRSNVVSVVQEARIFLPKAFIPNSEIPENRVWKPGNLYAQDNSYSLIITDRWGKTMFQSNNPEEGWDGTADGGYAPQGVYVFVLKYKSFDGLVKEEKGFITLLN